jgi:tetratricopeptide (TPR) repeat protein
MREIAHGRVGLELSLGTQATDRMVGEPTTFTKAWFDAFPGAADATPLLSRARMIKTPQEVARLRIANEIAAQAMHHVRSKLEPGMKESEAAAIWQAYVHGQGTARDDVERAKTLAGLRSDVFLLAGIIYFDRQELEKASGDLARAWRLNDTACDAAWYLGLVRSEQKQWEVAAAMFPSAAACYRSTADIYRAQLAEAGKVVSDEHDRAALDADYARLIDQQLVSEARSYYNAAYACAQRGDRDRALEFAERAEQHPFMKAKAEELITALKKSG